ncbi:MAG: hypothetical protein ACRCS9_15645 [Hyphomicrobium sp.]
MTSDIVRHQLSFAVCFIDHFSGDAVATELPVRLGGSFQRPAPQPGGRARRQSDGSYRFTNAPPGAHRILWRDPLMRTQSGWARWDDPEPQITLPLADPAVRSEFELWPTAEAEAPNNVAAVRGKLDGPSAGGLDVRIAQQGQPFNRFTRSDLNGEFLFLLGGRLLPNSAGLIALTIEVRPPGGAVRVLSGGHFVPTSTGTAFPAADFEITPGAVARIRFQLL